MVKRKQTTRQPLPQDECLEGIRAVGDLAARLFLLDDPEALQTETVERATRILRCTSGMICLLGEDGGAPARGKAVGKAKDLAPADLLAVGPVAEVVLKERRPLVLNAPELTLGRGFRGRAAGIEPA